MTVKYLKSFITKSLNLTPKSLNLKPKSLRIKLKFFTKSIKSQPFIPHQTLPLTLIILSITIAPISTPTLQAQSTQEPIEPSTPSTPSTPPNPSIPPTPHPTQITKLYQKDFDQGTYLITKPGKYQLAEDISFNPNSTTYLKTDAYHAGNPLPEQFTSKGGKYDDLTFGIGFFAAITISTDNVTLDLNNHAIEQSAEHALLQRFFAVIELANQPFIPTQGPHFFGKKITSASNVTIKNGTIGRSSHHGIHGNGNKNVKIENINFKDFEIAAVALNGVNGLEISHCTAACRGDIPVLGVFSSARFLQPYLDYLVETKSKTTLNIGNSQHLTATQIRDKLRDAINNVHHDLIVLKRESIDPKTHPEEYALFHNPSHVVDGNCYGFLINPYGVAVDGFPIQSLHSPNELAKNIKISDVHITKLSGKVNDVIALNNNEEAMIDPVGSVFQIKSVHPDTEQPITLSSASHDEARYIGNIVANAQALVGKTKLNGDLNQTHLSTKRLNITQKVIEWIEADPSDPRSRLSWLAPNSTDFLCNGDSMFHVNKGVVGFKIDGCHDAVIENLTAENISNLSDAGSEVCGFYKFSHPKATLIGCGGPKTRAYSFAASSHVRATNCTAKNITSRTGSAIGFDILTDSSDISIDHCIVDNIHAGKEFKKNKGPNEDPKAIAFCIGPSASKVTITNSCGRNLEGKGGAFQVMDDGRENQVKIDCSLSEIR